MHVAALLAGSRKPTVKARFSHVFRWTQREILKSRVPAAPLGMTLCSNTAASLLSIWLKLVCRSSIKWRTENKDLIKLIPVSRQGMFYGFAQTQLTSSFLFSIIPPPSLWFIHDSPMFSFCFAQRSPLFFIRLLISLVLNDSIKPVCLVHAGCLTQALTFINA